MTTKLAKNLEDYHRIDVVALEIAKEFRAHGRAGILALRRAAQRIEDADYREPEVPEPDVDICHDSMLRKLGVPLAWADVTSIRYEVRTNKRPVEEVARAYGAPVSFVLALKNAQVRRGAGAEVVAEWVASGGTWAEDSFDGN